MTAPAEYTEEIVDPSETVEAPQADVAVTSEEGGVLILGGTPIGNLADASDRLRSALATADLIAVEDTRKLRTLASGLGVRTRGRVIVNHDHNEEERSATIVQAVQEGSACYCSRMRACPPSPTPATWSRQPLRKPTCPSPWCPTLRCTDRARALGSAHRTIYL